MTIRYHKSNSRMSELVIHENTVYGAGQVADDYYADAKTQTQQILANIESLLADVGSSKEYILSVQIWLSDLSDFDQLNEVWDAWVVEDRQPARACVESKLANPNWKVEMMFTAALPKPKV